MRRISMRDKRAGAALEPSRQSRCRRRRPAAPPRSRRGERRGRRRPGRRPRSNGGGAARVRGAAVHRRLDLEDAEELAHGVGRLLESHRLLGRQRDLDDLLDSPALPSLTGHAEVDVAASRTRPAGRRRTAGSSSCRCSTASTISTTAEAGAYQAEVFRRLTISAPPSRVRLTIASIFSLGSSCGQRDPGDRREPRQRHHRVAVAPEHERVRVLDRDVRARRR